MTSPAGRRSGGVFARALRAEIAHLARSRWDQVLLVVMPLALLGAVAAMLFQGVVRDAPVAEAPIALPRASEGAELVADYASLRLTLGRHPLELLRRGLIFGAVIASIAGLSLTHTVGKAVMSGIFTSHRPFLRTPKCQDPAMLSQVLCASVKTSRPPEGFM